MVTRKGMVKTVLIMSLLGGHSAWSCIMAKEPTLPTQNEVDQNSIIMAKKNVDRYMRVQKRFLKCTNNDRKHNLAVDKMKVVAGTFNELLTHYNASSQVASAN